jgi:hypothetical protein
MRRNRVLVRAFVLVAVLGLGLAACGDDGGGEADDTTTTAEETTTTEEEVFDPDGDDTTDDSTGGDSDEGDQETFAEEFTAEVSGEIDVPTGTPYDGYGFQSNSDETIEAEWPDEWAEVNGEPGTDGTRQLTESTDLDAYYAGYEVPGATIQVVATEITDTADAVEQIAPTACDQGPTEELDLEDDYYYGHYIVGSDCDGTTTDFVTIAADRDAAGNALAVVGVQIVTTADLEALETLLATFLISTPG